VKQRLTADQLVDLERWAADDLRGDEQREVWALVDELRARRARDLTPAEVAVLRDAAWLLCSPWGRSGADEKSAATALSKLMGYGEGQP
jgi:hypothetical protein